MHFKCGWPIKFYNPTTGEFHFRIVPCNKKSCAACQRRRAAERFERFKKTFGKLKEVYIFHVTLTNPDGAANDLWITRLLKKHAVNSYRTRWERIGDKGELRVIVTYFCEPFEVPLGNRKVAYEAIATSRAIIHFSEIDKKEACRYRSFSRRCPKSSAELRRKNENREEKWQVVSISQYPVKVFVQKAHEIGVWLTTKAPVDVADIEKMHISMLISVPAKYLKSNPLTGKQSPAMEKIDIKSRPVAKPESDSNTANYRHPPETPPPMDLDELPF